MIYYEGTTESVKGQRAVAPLTLIRYTTCIYSQKFCIFGNFGAMEIFA